MKNTLMILTTAFFAFSNTHAFAGNYSINGISFQSLTLSTQQRQYRGDDTASCEIRVKLFNKKSYFSSTAVMKGNRKATCADLISTAIANFINPDASESIHAQLLQNLGNRTWSNVGGDMDESETPANVLDCKIYVNNIQNTSLDTLCYGISQNRGFSTKE